MARARSRLRRSRSDTSNRSSSSFQIHNIFSPLQDIGGALVRRYLKYTPIAVLAVVCWVIVGYLITTYPPAALANWLLPQSYLPLIGMVWCALFFSSAFLLLHTRRGILLATGIMLLLWMHLHAVQLTSIIIGSVLGGLFIWELLLTLWIKIANRSN